MRRLQLVLLTLKADQEHLQVDAFQFVSTKADKEQSLLELHLQNQDQAVQFVDDATKDERDQLKGSIQLSFLIRPITTD